jgi:hypothetical protein
VEDETAYNIENQYKKVDAINSLSGSNSMSQAMIRANESIPSVQRNHSIDVSTFRVLRGSSPAETLELVRHVITDIFKESYRIPQQENGKYKTSLNDESRVRTLLEAIDGVPGAYGTRNGKPTMRRFLPCYREIADENSLHCVIPLIDPAYTSEMIEGLDVLLEEFMVSVPKEGAF